MIIMELLHIKRIRGDKVVELPERIVQRPYTMLCSEATARWTFSDNEDRQIFDYHGNQTANRFL